MPREPVTLSAQGCGRHRRLLHPETQAWVDCTPQQMTAIRLIHAYVGQTFIVRYVPCEECNKEPVGASETP